MKWDPRPVIVEEPWVKCNPLLPKVCFRCGLKVWKETMYKKWFHGFDAFGWGSSSGYGWACSECFEFYQKLVG